MTDAVPSPEEAAALKAAVRRIDEMRAEVAVRRGMILAGPPREPQIITQADLVAELIRSGALLPVEVFGTTCKEYGRVNADGTPMAAECPCCKSCCDSEDWGYGLSDRFSTHDPVGSDCNAADAYILRPSFELMREPAVKAALRAVLEDEDARLA